MSDMGYFSILFETIAGYYGVTGIQGIPTCELCLNFTRYIDLSLNFSILSIIFKKYVDDPAVCFKTPEIEIDNPLDKRHPICKFCYEKTALKIKEIDEGPVEELPLYIGDDNIFIREFAVNKLKESSTVYGNS